jgi:exopolysaccharide biosynthesis polyprenyl glycosylphosphotransferase
MLKRRPPGALWPALLVLDAIAVNLAFVLAYYARYELQIGPEVAEANYAPLSDYLPILPALTLLIPATYAIFGVYRKTPYAPPIEEFVSVLQASSVGLVLALAGIFLAQNYAFSRLIFLYFWLALVVLAVLGRLAVRGLVAFLRRRGWGTRRVLVVGGGALAKTVMHVVATEPGSGYHLVGFVHDQGEGDIGRFRCLGSLRKIGSVIYEHRIDEVIIALPSTSHARALQITRQCDGLNVSFKLVPDLYEISLSRVNIHALRGVPLIGIRERSIHGFNRALKRVVDLTVALLCMIVTAPVFALAALAIKLDSPGPVFFLQKRVGQDGRLFPCLKFRSMYVDAERRRRELLAANEADGPLFKIRDDPRRTRVGRLLRRLSVDELPQLINVLRGEMSLIGPRPAIPSEVEEYEDWHRQRLSVPPGITGLWQVTGRSELPFDEMVLMDIYYIENWSLGLDLSILLRTLPAVLTGRGAY